MFKEGSSIVVAHCVHKSLQRTESVAMRLIDYTAVVAFKAWVGGLAAVQSVLEP